METPTSVPFTPLAQVLLMRAAHHPAYGTTHYRNNALLESTPSAHQRRATEVLAEFDALSASSTELLWLFILHYVCCEALAKLLIGSRNGVPPHVALSEKGPKIDLRKLKSINARLRLRITDKGLNRIFQQRSIKGHKSCRNLRNGLLHELRHADRQDIAYRGRALMIDMSRFIEAVRSVSNRGHIF